MNDWILLLPFLVFYVAGENHKTLFFVVFFHSIFMLTLWLKEKSRLAPDEISGKEKGTFLSKSHNWT